MDDFITKGYKLFANNYYNFIWVTESCSTIKTFLWYIKKIPIRKFRRRIPIGEMIANSKSDDAITKWKDKGKSFNDFK